MCDVSVDTIREAHFSLRTSQQEGHEDKDWREESEELGSQAEERKHRGDAQDQGPTK